MNPVKCTKKYLVLNIDHKINAVKHLSLSAYHCAKNALSWRTNNMHFNKFTISKEIFSSIILGNQKKNSLTKLLLFDNNDNLQSLNKCKLY